MLRKSQEKQEIQDIFEKVADLWVKNDKSNDYEPVITLKTLRAFYENSPAIFDKVANHKLLVAKLSMKM